MSKMEFAPNIKNIISFLLLLILIGCAEIGPPPGGEIDKTKPRILGSTPLNGSLNVEPDIKIIVTFSERVIKPTSKKQIYISPRPKSEIKTDWKSDKVIITLPDSFAMNQTYIISFAEGLQDLRRNPLDSGSIIAFTTGSELSNGIISGMVVDNANKPKENILVALYQKEEFDNAVIIDSLYPTYMVITDNDGLFSFQYIPHGQYQLLTFLDKNKSERLEPELELYGLTDRDVTLDSMQNKISNLLLTLTEHDDNNIEILSVRQTNNNIIRIDFNRNIINEFESISQNLNITLQNYDDSITKHSVQYILQSDTTSIMSINTYFGIIPESNYKLELNHNDTQITFDSISIKQISDKVNPEIYAFTPKKYPIDKDSLNITIQFSEPLDSTLFSDETVYIIDTDSNIVTPKITFINQSLCSVNLDFIKPNITKYKLYISEFDIFDVAGNSMGDSTFTKEINIINRDSLGTIKGTVTTLNQQTNNSQTFIRFKNILTKQVNTRIVTDTIFELQLLQGNYILDGFIDINNNNIRDFGLINPLLYAEPFTTFPDTIKVRARFETTDIKLEFK